MIKNQPKHIYLQMGLEEENSVEDFNTIEPDFVTWERGQIYSDDLKFLSVDFILARIKELETELNNEDGTYSEASCRFRIDELKNLLK